MAVRMINRILFEHERMSDARHDINSILRYICRYEAKLRSRNDDQEYLLKFKKNRHSLNKMA